MLGVCGGAGGLYDLGGRIVHTETEFIVDPQPNKLANVGEFDILLADFIYASGWDWFA